MAAVAADETLYLGAPTSGGDTCFINFRIGVCLWATDTFFREITWASSRMVLFWEFYEEEDS